MNSLKSKEEFIQDLVDLFPEIKDEIKEEDDPGIITLQIGCFRHFTQEAIDNRDFDTLMKCYGFVERNIALLEYKMENTLYISWLGKLDFQRNQQAEKSLPVKLKNAFEALKIYDASTSKNERLNQFLDDHLLRNNNLS